MNAGIAQIFTLSLELIILEVAVVVAIVLSILVYRNDKKNATGIIFILLSLSAIFWLISAYIIRVPDFPLPTPLLGRLGIFFAAPLSALFFLFGHTFPSGKIRLSRKMLFLIVSATIVIMALNISPFAFTDVKVIKGSIKPMAGLGLMPFAVVSTLFSVLAIYFLIKRHRVAQEIERRQIAIVLLGTLLMLALIISTVLVPILVFNSGIFVPLTPIYTLIFLGMAAYAIVRHHLFNIKLIATEAVTAIVWIILLSKVLTSESFTARVTDVFIFILTVIFGVLLIRTVRKEVEQRERLEVLTKELQTAYDKLKELDQLKTEFLGFAAHQVKEPMTVVKGFAQLVADGTYGQVSDKIKETAGKIKDSADRTLALVNNLLDLRKIEAGEFLQDIKFEELDIVAFLSSMVEEYEIIAAKKNLALSFESAVPSLKIKADSQKIRQVIQNILDNALKYTDQGYVKVSVKDESSTPSGQLLVASGSVLITVSDSGHGLSKELQAKLFQRFVRDEQTKREIEGTGLGLYLAKEIVAAHHGEIWAESDGEGKGSRFYVRLSKGLG